jgi:Putative Flp pilus-assembly TadE/G-like
LNKAGARPEGSRIPLLRRSLLARGRDRGQVMVLYALLLPVLLGFGALVVDVGHAFVLKRHLQKSADAAALAAAFELPDQANATTIANQYSGSAGGHNLNPGLPNVTTEVSFPAPTGLRVKVVQRATAQTFFAGVLGISPFNVKASAVASRLSTTGGSPLAVYVHELCGASSGNKGLHVNGQDALIQGGIHVNGQFKVGNSGFESESESTVYRPPTPPSVAPPTQGACNGSGSPKIENEPSARYCTIVCAPGNLSPTYGAWRDWVTPYHTADIVENRVEAASGLTCTNPNPGGDWELKASDLPGGVLAAPTCYRLDLGKKFTLSGAVKGPSGTHARLTVIAGDFNLNTTAGAKLQPVVDSEPVLFGAYKNSGPGEIIINPAGAFDWIGYVINRKGGMTVNSGGVVSPREGLLEAEWIVVNGQNFNMRGTFPDSSAGGPLGAVVLEE